MTLPASIKILLRAVRLRTGIAAATAAALVCAAPAIGSAPDWWEEYGVIDSEATADDYAAVNAGQLKNVAAAAAAYLEHELAPILGAGGTINTAIGAFGGSDDYLAVNIGQAKTVAHPFYARLIFIGYVGDYPWTGSSEPADDYALVNVGQVKNLFSFDLTEFDVYAVDTNTNYIPDWWEYFYFDGLVSDVEVDSDDDGQWIIDEFNNGTDPTKKDNPLVGLEVFTR